jgi:hypothetical protein
MKNLSGIPRQKWSKASCNIPWVTPGILSLFHDRMLQHEKAKLMKLNTQSNDELPKTNLVL